MIRKVSIWGINLTLLFLIVSKDLMYSELGFGSIYMHKNHAGFYYALSSIVFIYSSIFKGKNKKLDLCYFFISFSFLIHTSSSLALLNFLSAVSILFIIKLLKINYYVIIASLISIYFGVYFMILEPVMRFLGKSFTFTGRTVIWSESLNILFEKAYLGYGYASFFGDGPNFPSNRLHDMFVYYFAPNLHNGYLEVISQLGFLGLIIVLYIFSKSLRKIKNSRNIENNYRPFFFVLLSMILIENIGESVLMVHNHFITIFIIYLVNFTISTENKNFCLLYK